MTMTTVTKTRKPRRANPQRRPDIPALEQVRHTAYAQEMLALVDEIEREQGTRTTEEINALIEVMRGAARDADLSR